MVLLVRSAVAAVTTASAGATTSKVTLEALVSHSTRYEHSIQCSRTSHTPSQSRPFASSASRPCSRHSQPLRPSGPSRARAFSGSSVPLQHSQTYDQAARSTSDLIRALMRASAQPVALVTTFLPPTAAQEQEVRWIHGATLSSFSSISLDPNLVTFSMKTPSKLASALQHHLEFRTSNRLAEGKARAEEQVDFVVNILSDKQASLAAAYAIPGTSPLSHGSQINENHDHPLQQAGLIEVRGKESLPVVQDAVGAFGCQIVNSIDLSQYAQPDEFYPDSQTKSILYIARVIYVHHSCSSDDKQPLVYHQHKFVSTSKTPLT